jgi:hypothetical chaperone protein
VHIGIDFGTTNSGAGFFDGEHVRLFSIDPAGHPPTIARSTLYITRDHNVLIGRHALESYYEQNSGRARKLVREYAGLLSQVYSDGMEVVERVYAQVDELSPGRLLRSLKSELAGSYEATRIFGRVYPLEELIGLFLGEIRCRVEEQIDSHVDGLVLGRPVNFVGQEGAEANRRAEARLRLAAEHAGFKDITFELEPVAAALYYELGIEEPQNILVFDFGGGTLDLTIMRVGTGDQGQIFATGGVGIAGDVFDRHIVARLLLEHFGRNTTWSDQMPFPTQYTDALLNWQTVLDLNRPEVLRFLRQVEMNGSHPARVRALESLIVNEEAIRLYDTVEQAKIALSDERFALIRLVTADINLWQPITRSQFEALIGQELERIRACLLNTLADSGLRTDEIDAVVRTGGSSQIPVFIHMLEEIFGSDKVILSEVFSGVTSGLAIRAGLLDGAASWNSVARDRE